MKAYSTYQETGERWLECVPSDWKFKRFKYLFEIRKRIAGKLGFDVLSITQKGIKVKDITSGEGQLASDYSKYQIVKLGDFAMNHMDLLTGFVDLSEFEGVTSPDYRVFTLTAKDCSPQFCLYILQMGYTDKVFYPLGQGAAHVGRWRLPTESFRNFKSPIPSLNEQQRIVKYLDNETSHIDRLIQEKQNFIKLLEEKRQALISHVVTKGLDDKVEMKDSGVEWIGEVPKHWVVTRLKFLVEKLIDTEHKTIPFVDSSDFYVIRTSNIRKGKLLLEGCKRTDQLSYIDWTRRGKPIGGDIILTREAPAGEACIVPDDRDVCLGQRTVLVKTKPTILNKFLLFLIYSKSTELFIENVSMGSTVKHLNMSDIPNIPVFLPEISTQTKIVEYLEVQTSKIEELAKVTVTSIELLKERRSALISAAVTGKIDVREAI